MRSTILQFCHSTDLYFKDDVWPSGRYIVSGKNTQYQLYVCIKTYLYVHVSGEISAHLITCN